MPPTRTRRVLCGLLLALVVPLAIAAPAHADAPAAPPIVLWLDPTLLAPATDPAAEARVFEQTLTRTIELFLPVPNAGRQTISQAAAGFAARRPLLLQVARFDSGSPLFELVPDAARPDAAAILAHRAWADRQRGADPRHPVLELFVDVNALRHGFEPDFSDGGGRARRVIHALGVPNARSVMLHASWIDPAAVPSADPELPLPASARKLGEYKARGGPPLVRLDLSWNSRADEPTTIRGRNVAAGHWPAAQLRADPPPAPFLCIFRAPARIWIDKALAIRSAWLEPDESGAFDQACTTWLRTNRTSIDRITGSLPSWLLVYPDAGRADTLIASTFPRADGPKADAIVTEFDQLIRRDFNDSMGFVPDGGTHLRTPLDWPLREIAWNPAPRPLRSDVRFCIRLRGGPYDSASNKAPE